MNPIEKARRAREIAERLAELRKVATDSNMPFLDFLLHHAEQEAASIQNEALGLRVIDGGREEG